MQKRQFQIKFKYINKPPETPYPNTPYHFVSEDESDCEDVVDVLNLN